jgi:hypothetical protein
MLGWVKLRAAGAAAAAVRQKKSSTPWMWGYLQAVWQNNAVNTKMLNALCYKTATPPGTSAGPQLHEGTHWKCYYADVPNTPAQQFGQ